MLLENFRAGSHEKVGNVLWKSFATCWREKSLSDCFLVATTPLQFLYSPSCLWTSRCQCFQDLGCGSLGSLRWYCHRNGEKRWSINVSKRASASHAKHACIQTGTWQSKKIALLLGTSGTLWDMKLFRPTGLSQRLRLDGPTWLNQCHVCHSCLICDAAKAPDL